ncbi:ribonuclease HIII [Anaerofustis stercorihominis]|uniref:Ribonuclease n=1 Tax=Anaerofustis stercorihominis TaxID=214853 RepID=A0A3E3E273_9FIRM|nr:ribonuclease HIII [Anaerofustis stercorihominis]RGD75028.1 ribonuclease HIII [Anaerofustis stercorihominis]
MNKTPEDLYLRIKNANELVSYSVSDFKKIAYGLQFYIDNNIVRIYSSKKKGITLDTSQSKSDELSLILNSIYDIFQGNGLSSSDFDAEKNQLYPIMDPPLLGSDEVGKGDFYAPIIVGSVYLEKNEYDILKNLGVRDSKDLSDDRIIKLASEIKKVTNNYSILRIGQSKYNELYKKIGNINAILAWAHVTNIKNVYKKQPFKKALVDKFGREEQIRNGLKELNLEMIFKPKAEQNIAVAAASILARDALLTTIKNMNKHYDFDFPLGANSIVITKGKEFVKKFGEEELNNVCKMHFKTVQNILN